MRTNLNARLSAIEVTVQAQTRRQDIEVSLAGLSAAELVAKYREIVEQHRSSPEGMALAARLKGLSIPELMQLRRQALRGLPI